MTTPPTVSETDETDPATPARWQAALAIAFGCALTLAIQGYQFGQSNHTVYLLDALRHVHPELLNNDWFATRTLQYHAAFGWMTRGLMQLNVIQPAFFAGYLALFVLLHVAWWKLVKALGGDVKVFVISEVLFHLSAGGAGLGMYQFLQDGAFLPSNISAVAMLWAIVLWMTDRRLAAGVCLGVAGLLHLNYALVGVLLWTLLHVCQLHVPSRRRMDRAFWLGTLAAVGPSMVNIAFALRATANRSGAMPLGEFVDLYVHLRHPHHYDPASWPAWLWISFLWPIPLAVISYLWTRREGSITYAWQEAGRFFVIFSFLTLVALIGAGVAYTSESLIQASLYRFSVFVKLLSCVGAAILIIQTSARRVLTSVSIATGVVVIVVCVLRGPYGGLFRVPADDAEYLAACDWIRDHTPEDAVFLVPPSEQEFRLRAQRGIVVNFKAVPQLSGELREWRDRMKLALDMPDLMELPRPFGTTLKAIAARYESLPPDKLEKVAKQYGARYVLVGHALGPDWEARRIDLNANPKWFLYDLAP